MKTVANIHKAAVSQLLIIINTNIDRQLHKSQCFSHLKGSLFKNLDACYKNCFKALPLVIFN